MLGCDGVGGKSLRDLRSLGLLMKTCLLLLLFCAVAGANAADNLTAPVNPRRNQTRERPAPTLTREQVTGVVPRAVRGGNPLQMLNPGAPQRYGTAEEHVTYKPDYPGKWNGIKLVEIVW